MRSNLQSASDVYGEEIRNTSVNESVSDALRQVSASSYLTKFSFSLMSRGQDQCKKLDNAKGWRLRKL